MPRVNRELKYEHVLPYKDKILSMIDTSAGPDACHPAFDKDTNRNPDGYKYFELDADGRHVQSTLTRVLMVLVTKQSLWSVDFVDHYVCHTPWCNNIAHLRVTDAKGNAQTAIEAGRYTRNRKFTDEEVFALRHRWAAGESLSALARETNTRYHTLREAVLGITYKNVPMVERDGQPQRLGRRVLSASDVSIIKTRILLGHRYTQIGREFGVSPQQIGNIAHGYRWYDVEPMPLSEYLALHRTEAAD